MNRRRQGPARGSWLACVRANILSLGRGAYYPLIASSKLQPKSMADGCVFCAIAQGSAPASIVCENDLALAAVDLRQFHPGHTLVLPRQHFHDVGELDDAAGAALMAMVSRVTRAVARAFPNQGLSLWHSIGEAAFQEVPHLHIHIHPRFIGDNVLRVYPQLPTNTQRSTLDSYAAILRSHLD